MTYRLGLLVVVIAALASACPAAPPTPLALPDGLPLNELSDAQSKLLRATLAVDGGVLSETDVALDVKTQTISGDIVLNVAEDGTHAATLRVYGRADADAEEVLLGTAVHDVDVKKGGAAFLDFAGSSFDSCDESAVTRACSIAFDRNRNGKSNIDDLVAGIDPAPQAPFVATAPDTLQFASGIRTGSFTRQVVVVENLGEHPIRVTRVQVAGGQGVGASLFDPNAAVVAPPRRLIDEASLDKDGDGFSDFVVAPSDEAFIAVSFAPVNSFLTTSALQVSAVDTVTGVEQATRTKVIANADGALRRRDPAYVEPTINADGTIAVAGVNLVAAAFPSTQLFSGAEVSTLDSDDNQGLQSKGQALIIGDFAMPADGAFVVDIAPGTRFSAAVAGLASDIDLAVVGLSGAAAGTLLASSDNKGTSPEAVDLVNTTDETQQVAVVLGRIEETPPAALAGALSLDVRAPFRLTCQVTKGPELDDVDPIVPARGPLEGGITVRVHGRGFFVPAVVGSPDHVRVSFNGFDAIGAPKVITADDGAQTIEATLPPGAVSSADVPTTIVVENPAEADGENADGQAATLAEGFRYDLPTPRINRVTPDAAGIDGGSIDVVISGAFFFDRYGAPVVDFGGVTANAIVVDAGTLIVTPPAHAEGRVDLTVSNVIASGETGQPSNTIPFFFRTPTLPAPTVTGIDVAEGTADGGTSVVVTGTNFAGARVFFGGATASVVDLTATAITVLTPRVTDASVVDVIVQNSDGQTAVLANAFTYILPPPSVRAVFPARSIVDGGATVVVTGGGFRSGARVHFVSGAVDVDAPSAIVSNSSTIVVTTPPFAAAGDVSLVVENPDLQAASAAFTYFVPSGPAPRLVAIDPQVGNVAGGDVVTLLGSDFTDPSVVFGDTVISDVTVEDAANGLSRIVVTSPPGSAGAALVTVVNGDGQSDSITFSFVDRGEPRVLAVTPSVVHALIPGDEILVFGEHLSLLTQPTARARVGNTDVDLALTAVGDTLARLVITAPLPQSNNVVIQLLGGGSVVSAPPIAARRPNVARIDITASGNTARLLMIGDNLAGDRLTGVRIKDAGGAGSIDCRDPVADERLLTCDATFSGNGIEQPVVELAYGDVFVDDADFVADDNGDGGNPGGGDPRCIDVPSTATCTAGNGFFGCTDTHAVTWLQAHCECNFNGAELPVLDNAAEHASFKTAAGRDPAWIGLEDAAGTAAYDTWVDGTPVSFNLLGLPATGGQCGFLAGDQWKTRACDDVTAPKTFVCEGTLGGGGGGATFTNAAPATWPNDILINGANLAGISGVTFNHLGGLGSEFVAVQNSTPTELRVSSRGLTPGSWNVCFNNCVELTINPPANELEPNDDASTPTGVAISKPIIGSISAGESDFYFVRPQSPTTTQLHARVTPDSPDCGFIAARFDGNTFTPSDVCSPIDIFVNVANDAEQVIEVNAVEGLAVPYTLVVFDEVAAPVCPNGIVESGEQCDTDLPTCTACVEVDEDAPFDNDFFNTASDLTGVPNATERTLTQGDVDIFRVSGNSKVSVFRIDGQPCDGLLLDPLDNLGGVTGPPGSPEAGSCGTLNVPPVGTQLVRVIGQFPITALYRLDVAPAGGGGGGCGNRLIEAGEECDEGPGFFAFCDVACHEPREFDSAGTAEPIVINTAPVPGTIHAAFDQDFFSAFSDGNELFIEITGRDGGCASGPVQASVNNGFGPQPLAQDVDGCVRQPVLLQPGPFGLTVGVVGGFLRYQVRVGSGGGFVPPPDLTLWLNAASLSGLSIGTPLAEWGDDSGLGNVAFQNNGSAQPIFFPNDGPNGTPVVRFDGVDDTMDVGIPLFATADSGLTIFTAFSVNDLSQQRFLMALPEPGGNCTNSLELGYHTGDGDRANFGVHSGCSNATVTTTDIDFNFRVMTTRVLPGTSRPGNVEIFDDGAQQTLEMDQLGWTDAGNYPTAPALVFGSRNGDGFHSGDIAEVLIFTRNLSEAERLDVEAYLRSKYSPF